MSCSNPIAFEMMVAWWLGELSHAEQDALEEHMFACAHCTRRVEELATLAGGVRNAVRAGAMGLVVSAPFVEGMKKAGLRVREYHLTPGSSVNCTIKAEDDCVVSRLQAQLAGVERLDLAHLGPGGEVRATQEDVPFDPTAGEVLVCPSAAALRKLPAFIERVRLIAVGAEGTKPLGEYTFVHTPSQEQG